MGLHSIKLRFLSISEDEATCARRGFRCANPEIKGRVESAGRTFLAGYHAALGSGDLSDLATRLEGVPLEATGFAYEGAAMALALLDAISPWRRCRLGDFLAGAAQPHLYMAHVGAGWALARAPFGSARILRQLDPLLRWLAYDGYGFHHGYFHWPRFISAREQPRRLAGYALRAFDQGLGRALWFVAGADAMSIADTISAFPVERQADLWSGIGLAAAYAGGMDDAGLRDLRARAAGFAAHLAQGAAFGAKARQRAGNPAGHTDRACRVLAGQAASAAAEITDLALTEANASAAAGPYEDWRGRIRAALQAKEGRHEPDRDLAEAYGR